MINPQEMIVKKITNMYEEGCTCVYKNAQYTKDTISFANCIAFTHPDTKAEEVVGFIQIDGGEHKEVDIKVSGNSLLFSDR